MTGETGKLTFHVFKDQGFRQEDPAKKFVAPINPEQFSQSFKIEYDEKQPQGTQELDPKYKKSKAQELSLDFTLDGTGVVPDKENPGEFHRDVPAQVRRFLDAVYVMNKETHKPNFLKIIWGSFIFKGTLIECQINYTLLSPEGIPLRAKLTTKYLGFVEKDYRVKKEGKKSPDITHVRKVKGGDRLDQMTYGIYNDPAYYLEVARVNNLSSLRRLETNQDLIFPPVEKTRK